MRCCIVDLCYFVADIIQDFEQILSARQSSRSGVRRRILRHSKLRVTPVMIRVLNDDTEYETFKSFASTNRDHVIICNYSRS